MKMTNLSDNTVKVYIGYLDTSEEMIIATSINKEVLKFYLENNRELSKRQYRIEKEIMNAYHYYAKYNAYILEEAFNNIYLTNRDIEIIGNENCNFIIDMKNTLDKLKYYSLLINRIKKTKDDVPDFIKVIEDLEKYTTKDKLFNKIENEHYLSHPIIHCDINTYLSYIRVYEESKDLTTRYKNACDD